MLISLLSVFLFSAFESMAKTPVPLNQSETAVSKRKNLSNIIVEKLVEDYNPCFKGKVDRCSGSVSSKTPLDKIGLTKKELKDSVYCIAADFDYNGSMDFVIWGARHSRQGWESRDNLVLLFDGPKIIFEKVILNKYPLCLYVPATRRGRYGEPKTNIPGLIMQGEGELTTIFLWDKKKKDFIPTEYGSGE